MKSCSLLIVAVVGLAALFDAATIDDDTYDEIDVAGLDVAGFDVDEVNKLEMVDWRCQDNLCVRCARENSQEGCVVALKVTKKHLAVFVTKNDNSIVVNGIVSASNYDPVCSNGVCFEVYKGDVNQNKACVKVTQNNGPTIDFGCYGQ